jgi:Trk K+ transport system NAD-binding subunit
MRRPPIKAAAEFRRLSEVTAVLPPEVRIVALRREQQNQPASPELVLRERDVLLGVAPSRAMLDRLEKTLGEAVPCSSSGCPSTA